MIKLGPNDVLGEVARAGNHQIGQIDRHDRPAAQEADALLSDTTVDPAETSRAQLSSDVACPAPSRMAKTLVHHEVGVEVEAETRDREET